MFELFMRFLISTIYASNHAMCMQCVMIQRIRINSHPNKHNLLSMFIMITGRTD